MTHKRFSKVLALLLLCGSAWFNYDFTYTVLYSYLGYAAFIPALLMSAVNLSAFYVDMDIIRAAKSKQYLSTLVWCFIRAMIIVYSVVAASSVLNTSQEKAKYIHNTADIKAQQISNETAKAELNKNKLLTSIRSDSVGQIFNAKGQAVAFKYCTEGSYYSNQQPCRNYLDSMANSGAQEAYLDTYNSNLQKTIDLRESLPLVMQPIGGFSVELIFKIIAFLLDACALALVLYSEYYADKIPPLPRPSGTEGVKPPTGTTKKAVQSDKLDNELVIGRRVLSGLDDVSDKHIGELIVELHKENYGKPLSANALNKIIKDSIGHTKNKADILDVMNDHFLIENKLENGQKKFYLKEKDYELVKPIQQEIESDGSGGRAVKTSEQKRSEMF